MFHENVVVLKVLQNLQGNTCVGVPFLINKLNISAYIPATLNKKATPAQMISMNFAMFSRPLFYRTSPVAAS